MVKLTGSIERVKLAAWVSMTNEKAIIGLRGMLSTANTKLTK